MLDRQYKGETSPCFAGNDDNNDQVTSSVSSAPIVTATELTVGLEAHTKRGRTDGPPRVIKGEQAMCGMSNWPDSSQPGTRHGE
jgi:hypothetical protein